MSRWRRRFRRLRRALVLGLASLLILAGLCVALLSQFLPSLQSRPAEVAAFMQRQLGVPVHLDAVFGEWTGSGVRLQLSGLRIGERDGPQIPDAVLWLRPFSGWWPGNTLSTLQITEPSLVVERVASGAWQVQGLGLTARGEALDLQLLERLGEVVLDRASLQLQSAEQGLDLRLTRVDARLRPVGDRLALALQVFVDDSPPLQLRLQASPDLRDGALHVGLRRGPLDRWLREALTTDWRLPASEGSGDVWVDWKEGRLLQAQFRTTLQPSAAQAGLAEGPVMRADEALIPLPTALAIEGRWQRTEQGGEWQLRQSNGADDGWLRYRSGAQGRSLELRNWAFGAWWPWLTPGC